MKRAESRATPKPARGLLEDRPMHSSDEGRT
jgi:hypothetical protein